MGRPSAAKSFGFLFAGCLLGLIANSGAFTGGSGSCGTFGFTCLGHGLAVLGVGCSLGAFIALRALVEHQGRGWARWLALVANGIPALALWLGAIFVFA